MRTLLAIIFVFGLAACRAAGPPVLVYAAADRTVVGVDLPDLDLFSIDPQSHTIRSLTGLTDMVEADPCLDVSRSRVVFVGQGLDGRTDLCLLVLDEAGGRTLKVLYACEDIIYTPAWSNDGKRIAFVERQPDGRLMIKLVNADGTGVTDLGYGSDPSWRMDDRAIYFNSSDTPEQPAGELMVRDLATGVVQSLGLRGDGFTNLQRGMSIVYTKPAYSRRNEAVWLIDANNKQTRLTDPGKTHRDQDPVHVNGTTLVAFTRVDVETNRAAIYVVDRASDDPVAVPFIEGKASAFTRCGERLFK